MGDTYKHSSDKLKQKRYKAISRQADKVQDEIEKEILEYYNDSVILFDTPTIVPRSNGKN